jgi:hypothetical protein
MAHNDIVKFNGGWKMNVAKKITKVKMGISRGLAPQHPVKLGGILALGALLMAGTAVQFAPKSNDEKSGPSSVSPAAEVVIYPEDDPYANMTLDEFDRAVGTENAPSYNQLRGTESIQERLEVQQVLESMRNPGGSEFNVYRVDPISLQDVTEFFGEDVVAALGYDVLVVRLNHYQADGPLTSRDMEHLDQDVDILLEAAANQSSGARAAYHREIGRLKEKISSMLAEASQNPSTNMSQLNREIERLDNQIDMLRLAAMR